MRLSNLPKVSQFLLSGIQSTLYYLFVSYFLNLVSERPSTQSQERRFCAMVVCYLFNYIKDCVYVCICLLLLMVEECYILSLIFNLAQSLQLMWLCASESKEIRHAK